MKTWTQMIADVHRQKRERDWTHLYWCIDLHDTIITGKYNRFNQGATLFPYAKETLDFLYKTNENIIILWSSSYTDAMIDIVDRFDLKFHHFNANPECPSNNLCDFRNKFYFNFLLDDKAGFDPHNDWREIYETLTNPPRELTNKQKRLIEESL